MAERCVVGKAYFDIYKKFRRDLIEGGVEKFDQTFPYYRETQMWLGKHLATCDQCRKAESEA